MWLEKEVNISEIEQLLDNFDVEIDSPDGWVPVSLFVDKGMWDEYELHLCDNRIVKVNENHLFETIDGWKFAKELCISNIEHQYLCDTGIVSGKVVKTGKTIPIVDIQVDHKNHRYYSNGVSSHNTNVGKSLLMCHMAAATLKQGKNVLYITLEMAEERIAERIDCNLLDIPIDQLPKIDRKTFNSKLETIKSSCTGQLIVKEYPTAGAHAGHFRSLLDELSMKKGFKPDLVLIDYLNICASQRYTGSSQNSYTIIKSIAEELRGMAVEYDIPIMTATQTTRAGSVDSDIDMTSTSESFGVPMTLDFFFAMVRTEELDEMGQVMIKQLKSRFNDVNYYKRFVIGLDIKKFKFYDVDNPKGDLVDTGRADDDVPVFDKSSFGKHMKQRGDVPELDFS
jgi:archaellum biogenesis ATPase FlaH